MQKKDNNTVKTKTPRWTQFQWGWGIEVPSKGQPGSPSEETRVLLDKAHSPHKPQIQLWVWWSRDASVESAQYRGLMFCDSVWLRGQWLSFILRLGYAAEGLRTGNNPKSGPRVRDHPGRQMESRHSDTENKVQVASVSFKAGDRQRQPQPQWEEQIASAKNNPGQPSLFAATARVPHTEVSSLDTDSYTPPTTLLMLRRAWKSKERFSTLHGSLLRLLPLPCPSDALGRNSASKNIRHCSGWCGEGICPAHSIHT